MSNSRRWRELMTWVYNYNAVRGYIPYDEIIAVIENINAIDRELKPPSNNMVECPKCKGSQKISIVRHISHQCHVCNGTGKVARKNLTMLKKLRRRNK